MKHALYAVAFLAGISASDQAFAGTCTEPKLVPAHMECDGSSSNSADFTNGCRAVPEQTVNVTVPCTPKWYNATVPYITGLWGFNERHQAFCNKVGKTASSINGQVCASGKYRPSSGEGYDKILYRFGTSGGGGVGGLYFRQRSLMYGGDMSWAATTNFTQACARQSNSSDINMDNQLDWVVAFVCE